MLGIALNLERYYATKRGVAVDDVPATAQDN